MWLLVSVSGEERDRVLVRKVIVGHPARGGERVSCRAAHLMLGIVCKLTDAEQEWNINTYNNNNLSAGLHNSMQPV